MWPEKPISLTEGGDSSVDQNAGVFTSEVTTEGSEWLKELREDDDYRENSINVGNDYKDVKLPRCSRRFRVGDFFIDEGELKLVLENSIVKVVPNLPLETKARRVKREHAYVNHVSCRATLDGDGNNEALGTFFRCPGSLARVISIFESERNDDRRRYLMTDAKYSFMTIWVPRKRSYFPNIVVITLTLHDGSPLSSPHDGGTEIPITELNELNSEGVRFVKNHSWKDGVATARRQQRTLLLLPDGFKDVSDAFKPQRNVDRRVYWELSEVPNSLDTAEASICIVVRPTTAATPSKKDWCRVASAFATAARNGVKVVGSGTTKRRFSLCAESHGAESSRRPRQEISIAHVAQHH
ncbi:hypothetical protein COOONC_28003 [Cooperia oncophora]